jgi:hypothetical protein
VIQFLQIESKDEAASGWAPSDHMPHTRVISASNIMCDGKEDHSTKKQVEPFIHVE